MKESQPPISNNGLEGLAAFQEEINAIKSAEALTGEAHLKECDPFELGEEDKDLYEKFKSGYFDSKQKFEEYMGNMIDDINKKSHNFFVSYVANKISEELSTKFLAERKKKREAGN